MFGFSIGLLFACGRLLGQHSRHLPRRAQTVSARFSMLAVIFCSITAGPSLFCPTGWFFPVLDVRILWPGALFFRARRQPPAWFERIHGERMRCGLISSTKTIAFLHTEQHITRPDGLARHHACRWPPCRTRPGPFRATAVFPSSGT